MSAKKSSGSAKGSKKGGPGGEGGRSGGGGKGGREDEERERVEEGRRLEEEEGRRVEAARAGVEREEAAVREFVLAETCKLFRELQAAKLALDQQKRERDQWNRYVKCDHLPNPEVVPEMNTYLYQWRLSTSADTMGQVLAQVHRILPLLDILNEYIDKPLGAPARTVANWKAVRREFRQEIQTRIDQACFNLLQDLEENTTRTDYRTVEYKIKGDQVALGLWCYLDVARSELDTGLPPCVIFQEVGAGAQLPEPFNKEIVVLRVMRMRYNHLNDEARTYEALPLPGADQDLHQVVKEYFKEKERIRDILNYNEEDEDEFDDSVIEMSKKRRSKVGDEDEVASVSATAASHSSARSDSDTKALSSVPTSTESGSDIDHIFMGTEIKTIDELIELHVITNQDQTGESGETLAMSERKKLLMKPVEQTEGESEEGRGKGKRRRASEVMDERDKEIAADVMSKLKVTLDTGELNMRRYNVIGGVYRVDLLHQPHQRYPLTTTQSLTVSHGEYQLSYRHFFCPYQPPTIIEAKEDDDTEEKAGKTDDAMEKLIQVHITLPDDVLWFENPQAVQWDHENNIWTNKYVYDARFNDDRGMFSFRVGMTAPIGLATYRWANLPYQTWEMHPYWKKKNAVFFTITAATVTVEFIIKEGKVCLQTLQNATGSALQEMIGKYYEPGHLIRRMRECGLDLFPEHDTYLYVEGNCAKNTILEHHNYHCMAVISAAFNFSWSRWNLNAGRKKLVTQIREALDKRSLPNQDTLMVTPERALLVNCTEVSQVFTDQGIDGMTYYPDLHSLISSHMSAEAAAVVQDASVQLIETVYYMLKTTLVLSYS